MKQQSEFRKKAKVHQQFVYGSVDQGLVPMHHCVQSYGLGQGHDLRLAHIHATRRAKVTSVADHRRGRWSVDVDLGTPVLFSIRPLQMGVVPLPVDSRMISRGISR